jgi:hypothetical protein
MNDTFTIEAGEPLEVTVEHCGTPDAEVVVTVGQTPETHAATHAADGIDPLQITAQQITDFASAVVAAAPPTTNASLLTSGTLDAGRLPGSVVLTSDARLTDAREWSASTVSQADAEAGTSTSRFAFTPQRVFQAIAAWWAGSAAKTKLDGIATGATANATDAQLRDRSTHTGTQLAATISDFASAVVAAAPPTTNASLLTSGTLPDARLSSNIARTSDVSSAVAAVVNAAPATLDTLAELAAALGSDANFATTVTNSLAGKAAASHTHGNVTNDGRIGTTSGQVVVTGTGGALTTVGTLGTSNIADGAITAAKLASGETVSFGTVSAGTIAVGAGGVSTTIGSLSVKNITNANVFNVSSSGVVTVGTWQGTAIAVGHGGTGATTAAGALTNLGAVASNDARLTDARTPTAHKSSHATGGTDALTPSDIGAAAVSHTHTVTDVTGAVSTSDSRLTDARTPLAHATTHNPGGSDPVNLAQTFVFTRSSAPSEATTISAGRYDWTIPAGARAISIDAVAGGAGGGSGRRGAAGALRTGGSGGSGGSRSITTLFVSELLTNTLSVQVGRGTAGGAAVTSDDTNGNAGESNLTASSTWVRYNQNAYPITSVLLNAGGGGPGGGGTSAAVGGGVGWSGTFQGGAGGLAGTTGGASAPEVAAAPSGGGSGGPVYANNSSANGGSGGRVSLYSPTAFGGAAGTSGPVGGAGDNAPASTILVCGQGGGGGAAGSSGAGGNGGNGAFPGGGGGGGGASPNGFASGAGGNGADGVVRITVWY